MRGFHNPQTPVTRFALPAHHTTPYQPHYIPWLLSKQIGLRNVYKPGNVIGKTHQGCALAHAPKVLLTAMPRQTSSLELSGGAIVAATLKETWHWQKSQRAREDKRNKLRSKISDWQEEIDQQRSGLISAVEERLSVHVSVRNIFAVQWALA